MPFKSEEIHSLELSFESLPKIKVGSLKLSKVPKSLSLSDYCNVLFMVALKETVSAFKLISSFEAPLSIGLLTI